MSDDMHAVRSGTPHAPQGSEVVRMPSQGTLGVSGEMEEEEQEKRALGECARSGDLQAVPGRRAQARAGRPVLPLQERGSRAAYLIRTEDGDGTARQLFTDDEKNELTAQDQLAEYLISLIQVNRYAIGPAVRSIWRWDADDSFHEMHLTVLGFRQEADNFIDENWLLEERGNTAADITFTVTIDQKGQQ
jgi:hypothetical protein